jgi:hypothetical protein
MSDKETKNDSRGYSTNFPNGKEEVTRPLAQPFVFAHKHATISLEHRSSK